MTLFFWSAGLLLAATLLWLLRPLLFPADTRPCLPTTEQLERMQAQNSLLEQGEWSREQWQKAREQLAQEWLEEVEGWLNRPTRALAGWPMAVVLAFVIPLAGWQLYQRIGSPGIIEAQAMLSADPDSPEALQWRLEQRLKANANDLEAWVLLARLHHEGKRYQAAEKAYLQALELAPEEPLILVELAENRLFASGERQFDDQARQWLRDALTLDPGNQKALWMLGLDASQHQQWELAREYWESLMPQLPAGSSVYQAVLEQLEDVYRQLGEPMPAYGAATAEGLKLRVRVQLDEALRDRLPADAMLFVFARALDGPPMPVAAVQQPVAAFPVEIVLDDQSSLTPQRRLSDLDGWQISARIASRGQARGGAGSLEAMPVVIRREQADELIELTISQAR